MACVMKRSASDSASVKTNNNKKQRPQSEKTENETNIHMKYLLALKEAERWKKKYYALTSEKAKQLNAIESSLLLLEARLQAEKRAIDDKFQKQEKIIEDQQRKIETLTTANHKLLAGIMTLSQKHEKLIESPQSESASSQNGLLPSRPKSRDDSSCSDTSREPEISSQNKNQKKNYEKTRRKSRATYKRPPLPGAQRSKSLPMNPFQILMHTTSTTC